MFRFEHPEYFAFFAVALLLAGVYLASRLLSRRSIRRFATAGAADRLLSGWSRGRRTVTALSALAALLLLCTALVNPQWGMRREKVEAKSADIFIALDISNSMLARDIAPSRLERAKRFAQQIVNAFKGDRIGLILFAGNAYLQMPLTNDYASAALFIRAAHPGLATTQGTAIGDAVELAMRAYEEDEARPRALIILTDGENHEDGAIEMMERGAQAGLVPFIISSGTREGNYIPVRIAGREEYKRDENGVPIRTAVDEDFLRQLAAAGNGTLYSITDGDSVIEDLEARVAVLEKEDVEQRSFTDYRSYYQYFLLAGIVFLFVERFVGNRRKISRYA